MKQLMTRMAGCLFMLALLGLSSDAMAQDWPGFRGAGGKGVATSPTAPIAWDATDETDATDSADSSILWQCEVPGLGHSSPVVFGNHIYLTSAIAESGEASLNTGTRGGIKAAEGDGAQTWVVLCYDKATGELLWRHEANQGEPKATRHAKATHANASVAVDEQHVVAFFGSEGLYCYNHAGEVLWSKDLGVIDVSKYGIGWGYASSPSIHDGSIVIVCDAQADPYVAAFSVENGDPLWRRSREGDCVRSWGSPLIHETEKRAQIVVNGWPWIVSYDLSTGEEVWRIEGGGDNPTPSPFAMEDKIFVTNSHGGKSPIIVISEDAEGDLTKDPDLATEHVVWRLERGGSYMSTPVVVGEHLYLGNTNGVLRCFDALSGDEVYESRLGSGASIYSSLVAMNDKIYCPSEDGSVFVVQAGDEFELLARNPMGAPCLASPAISDGVLYVRTTESMLAIQGDE